jgi:hypothetical protein
VSIRIPVPDIGDKPENGPATPPLRHAAGAGYRIEPMGWNSSGRRSDYVDESRTRSSDRRHTDGGGGSIVSKRKQDARAQARAMIAAQRLAEARRKRLLMAGSVVGVVVLIVAVLVGVKLTSKPPAAAASTSVAPASVVDKVTGVPASVLDTIGKGSGLLATPKVVSGRPVLQAGGKPLVLYMGAEYCPYCAAQRWSLVEALSRFGTFTGLGQTQSSSTDTDPDTPTLSFHGATYTSAYLTFQGVELYSNQPAGSGYATLDTPTAAQNKLLSTDGNSSFPFIDFGDQAEVTSVMVDPGLLAGMTHQQVADVLSDPSNKVAQAFGGSANAFTTIICGLTGGQPASVCTSTAAQAYQSTYGGKS